MRRAFDSADRMSCNKCGATWWHHTPSMIHRLDHARPNGRNCAESRSYLAGQEIVTMTGLPPMKAAA